MKRSDEVRAVLIEGRVFIRKDDGSLVPHVDQTDYARLDAQTDEEIESIAKSDTEGPPMTDEDWARAEIKSPIKKPVGLKLDDDILDWFKSQGRGYQTRINAVLRQYVEARRKVG